MSNEVCKFCEAGVVIGCECFHCGDTWIERTQKEIKNCKTDKEIEKILLCIQSDYLELEDENQELEEELNR